MSLSANASKNAALLILVTLAGMVILVSAVPSKAPSPILFSWLTGANVTEVSAVAPENAFALMLVTLAGMVMLVSAEPANA